MPQVLFAGLTTIDVQYFVDQFPMSNQKVKCAPPAFLIGGPAANAAAGFAFLRGKSILLTAIGKNPLRKFIKTDLKGLGIDAFDIVDHKAINPVIASVITSSNGDRAILSHHPESHPVEIDLDALLKKLQPAAIMVDGFYPEMALAICKAAKQNKISTILDGGSWKPNLDALLPFLDVVICSADFSPPGCSSINDIFNFFMNQGIGKVAISRGEKSIKYCEEGEIGEVHIEKQNIIDTLGAGDFLHGAFCFYWSDSYDFQSSLKKASKFASATCRYQGTRSCFKEMDRTKFL